ncbi:MAG TPA: hypothetical protein VHB02_08935 [Acidimicrobiales bacterium]|nr:hypothetical protein [Acidimicrobiales bacterium]
MTTKIAVSLPDEAVQAARQAVAQGRAPSVSAYIASAVSSKARGDELAELLADMATDCGPADDDDRRWARTVLGID